MVNYYQASLDILGYQVEGIVNIEKGINPEATVLYSYDPITDVNRSDIVITGSSVQMAMGDKSSNKNGICVARDKILSVTGNTHGIRNVDFSLFAGMAIHTSSTVTKVREKYKFQYGLTGYQVDFDDEVFCRAEFSFNLFSENANITDSVLQEVQKSNNIPNDRLVWKTKLSSGVFLSLSKRFTFVAEPSRSYLQRELYFTLESENGISVRSLLEKYVEPIRSLISISFFSTESIRYVKVSKSNRGGFAEIVSPDFIERSEKIERESRLFNPGDLSKNNYTNWISQFKGVEYVAGLIELSFSASNLEYILGRMLPQLEQLFMANPNGSPSTKDFIKQVQHLLNDNEKLLKTCGFLTKEVDRSELAARIKNCRSYWIHEEILMNYPPSAADELIGIHNIVTFIYVLELLRSTKLLNSGLLDKDSRKIEDMSYRFVSGYKQWEALDLSDSQKLAISSTYRQREWKGESKRPVRTVWNRSRRMSRNKKN